mgnify:CR=1 FL=1
MQCQTALDECGNTLCQGVKVDEATEYCFKGAGIVECTQRLHACITDYMGQGR